MHRCLELNEVLQRIARSLGFDPLLKEPLPKRLLNMALTCRAFRGPALDELWRELKDIAVLLRLFSKHRVGRRHGRLVMISPPTEAEWAIFEAYARRVRIIDVKANSVDWHSVMKFHPNKQLFPNLSQIGCFCDDMTRYLPILTQSPVKRLSFSFRTMQNASALAGCVSTCAKTLNALTFIPDPNTCDDEVAESLLIADMFGPLRFLTTVVIGTPHSKTLDCLGALSYLRTLELHVFPIASHYNTEPLPFPVLVEVTINFSSSQSLDAIARLLGRVDGPKLQGIHVLPTQKIPRRNSEQLMDCSGVNEVISQVGKFAELSLLEFDTVEEVWDVPEGGRTLLQHLLPLRRMAQLHLSRIEFRLEVSDLKDIVEAWPNLWSLHLGERVAHNPSRPPPTTQLEDLLILADRCPRLNTIGLLVAVDPERTYDEQRPPFGQSKSGASALCLGPLEKGDYYGAAAFLASVFPRGEVVGQWDLDESDSWSEVSYHGDDRGPGSALDNLYETIKIITGQMARVGLHHDNSCEDCEYCSLLSDDEDVLLDDLSD
ncbi:hypothetical protein PsYK624_011610 [Phanerochaete sordida]|uniref:F-box domain-containing protein n=1 Tax=Phanerochaete sordida TaxID=48140 RepID=A0A9P3FZP6_9APHY|nr:hypothetical protein PsYK624_011610 [Phanerochaete sordida]